MRKFYPRFAFLALVLTILAAVPALAQPNVSPIQKQAPKSFFIAPIANQLQPLLQNLAPVPTAAPAPATTATGTAEPAPDTTEAEPQETFGTRALNFIIAEAGLLRTDGQLVVTDFAALPEMSSWLNQQINDPRFQPRWVAVGNDILTSVLPALIAALLLDFLFLPARASLRRKHPSNFAHRLGMLLGIVALRLIPILVFIGIALTLLNQNETQKFPRFIILNFVYAVTLTRLLGALARGLFAPTAPNLRMLPVSDRQSVNACRWISAYGIIIIFGYFLIDVARGIHVPASVITGFGNILGLVLVTMTLVVTVQKRAIVATFLRGNLSAAHHDLTSMEYLRLWFARRWHILAIAYLVIGYLIAALGVENGFTLMLRGTIFTLVILVAVRLALRTSDRLGMRDKTASDALHHTILRALLRFIVWGAAILGILASWGMSIPALFATSFGQRISGAALSIGTTVGVVALIYGAFNSAVESKLNRRDNDGKLLEASARMRTLLPMLRNTIFIIFTIIVGMVVLSEAGFNIGPLLAGAGIFGVALGFGSQTLVKDFLTGLFIVVENTIAIGDVIQIGDHKGVVDAMSVRTLRLRDNDGALHILPYSEVTQIINMTKDYGYAVMDVGVGYDSDLDQAMDVIRSVGEELQKDPIFKRVILEPLEVLGVEKLGDSSITIRSRMRTRPGKQWDVRRMFLLKLVQRFAKEGIDIPFPTVTNIQRPHIKK